MEALLGMYLASKADAPAGSKTHRFANKEEAYAAYKRGEINLGTHVEVGTAKAV
jgi:hypothetical protein